MLAKIESVALVGTEARLIDVEVDVSGGTVPRFVVVGLPTKSVKEAEQRTRPALESLEPDIGKLPTGLRVIANLAPGSLPKAGAHFDLPIALGILAGHGRLPRDRLSGWVAMGELALDGSIRSARGVLAAAIACREDGRKGLLCPTQNAAEAALVEGIQVIAVGSLRDCVLWAQGRWKPPPVQGARGRVAGITDDLSEVKGQVAAKRALEVAAAGGHNLLLSGPPGSGKTMLARRLPGILPRMSFEESLEVTRVYSVAGMLPRGSGLVLQRPFRSPHHHISLAGLVGGGTGLARPGEISLAHLGALFLDELPLYRREVLESLRAPLEEGCVRIARSGGVISFPCRMTLIAAMNPCPCGFRGDPRRPCSCSPVDIARYRAKVSGPLLDRIDMQVDVERLGQEHLLSTSAAETSAAVRERVEAARTIQTERYGSPLVTNASAPSRRIEEVVPLSAEAREVIGYHIDTMSLSGRGLVRVLRIARTVADLAGTDGVAVEQVAEALGLRLTDFRAEEAA